MDAYHTVYRGGSGEIVEKKSRFIAEVFPVTSEEEAMQYLEETRKRYWDARHHCWAYVLGRNPSAERMSDDGEPAGTAGTSDHGRARDRHQIFRGHAARNGRPCARLHCFGCRRTEAQ